MFVRVWRFEVRPEHDAEFAAMNGARGDWARLFARAEGYLGTTLEPVPGEPGAYRTTDRWRARADFDAFLERFGAEYGALDARAAAWTTAETLEFEGLADAPPAGP